MRKTAMFELKAKGRFSIEIQILYIPYMGVTDVLSRGWVTSYTGGGGAARNFAYKFTFKQVKIIFTDRLRVFTIEYYFS
jgi:hypothetical protein